jgi:hypothetical protein
MPVFGTIASKFNDDGVTALYHALLDTIKEKTGVAFQSHLPRPDTKQSTSKTIIIPPERTRYLAEIAETVSLPPRNRKPGRRHAAGVASGRNGQGPFGARAWKETAPTC